MTSACTAAQQRGRRGAGEHRAAAEILQGSRAGSLQYRRTEPPGWWPCPPSSVTLPMHRPQPDACCAHICTPNNALLAMHMPQPAHLLCAPLPAQQCSAGRAHTLYSRWPRSEEEQCTAPTLSISRHRTQKWRSSALRGGTWAAGIQQQLVHVCSCQVLLVRPAAQAGQHPACHPHANRARCIKGLAWLLHPRPHPQPLPPQQQEQHQGRSSSVHCSPDACTL